MHSNRGRMSVASDAEPLFAYTTNKDNVYTAVTARHRITVACDSRYFTGLRLDVPRSHDSVSAGVALSAN